MLSMTKLPGWTEWNEQTSSLLSALEQGPMLMLDEHEQIRYVTAPWGSFLDGAAEPFLLPNTPAPGLKTKALLLLAEAQVSKYHLRQECWSIELAQCIRMLRYHLTFLTSSGRYRLATDIERTPIVIYTAQSLRKLLQGDPRNVLLAAPSVSVRPVTDKLLPPSIDTLPPPATGHELRAFLPPLEGAGRFVLHELGNKLGPILTLQALGGTPSHIPSHSAALLRTLAAGTENNSAIQGTSRAASLVGHEVYLIDDDFVSWASIFKRFGVTPVDVLANVSQSKPNIIDNPSQFLTSDAIVLVDLRLDENSIPPRGFKVLEYLLRYRTNNPQQQPVLMAAFTSSSEQEFRHDLEIEGLDFYIRKPRLPGEERNFCSTMVDLAAFINDEHWVVTTKCLSHLLGRPFYGNQEVIKAIMACRHRAMTTRTPFKLDAGTAALVREQSVERGHNFDTYTLASDFLSGIVHGCPIAWNWGKALWSTHILVLLILGEPPVFPAGRLDPFWIGARWVHSEWDASKPPGQVKPKDITVADHLLGTVLQIKYLYELLKARHSRHKLVNALKLHLEAFVRTQAVAVEDWVRANHPIILRTPSISRELQLATTWKA